MADIVEALSEQVHRGQHSKGRLDLTPAVIEAAGLTFEPPQLDTLSDLEETVADLQTRAKRVAGLFANFVSLTNPDRPDLPPKITDPTAHREEHRKLKAGFIPLEPPDALNRDRIGFYPQFTLGLMAAVTILPVARGGATSRGMKAFEAPIVLGGRVYNEPTVDTLRTSGLTARFQNTRTHLDCMSALLDMLLPVIKTEDEFQSNPRNT